MSYNSNLKSLGRRKYLQDNDLIKYLRLDYEYDQHLRTIWVGDKNTEIAIGSDLVKIGTNLDLHGSNFNIYTGQTVFHGDVRIDGSISSGTAGLNGDLMRDFRVEDDLEVGDNIYLTSNGSSIVFGEDTDEYLLHIENSGFRLLTTASETGSVNTCLEIYNLSDGTVTDGFGGSFKFVNEADTGMFNSTGTIDFVSTDVTVGSSDGKFVFNVDVNNSLTEAMSLDGTGLTLTGDLAVNGDDITCDGALTIDTTTALTLDSGNGKLEYKNNGTSYSVTGSAYAGTILGYTTIGIDSLTATYTLTTTMTVLSDEHKVKFVAPPSGVVEIFAQIYFDAARRFPVLGLSDANATDGYSAIDFPNSNDVTNEHLVAAPPSSSGDSLLHPHWVVTGLTPGTAYEWWFAAKTSIGTGGALKWGGINTNNFPPFIMKATALPLATTDYAVYG